MFVADTMGIPVHLAHTMAGLGHCSSREAGCSSDADRSNIYAEIDLASSTRAQGFAHIDAAIQRLTKVAQRDTFFSCMTWGPVLSLCSTAALRLLTSWELPDSMFVGVFAAIWLTGACTCGPLFFIAKSHRGQIDLRTVVQLVIAQVFAATVSGAGAIAVWFFASGQKNPSLFCFLGAVCVNFFQTALQISLLTACSMLSCNGIQRMSSMLAPVWVPLVALLALLPAWFLMAHFHRSQLYPSCVLALLTSALLFGRLQHIWVLVGKWGIRQHHSGQCQGARARSKSLEQIMV